MLTIIMCLLLVITGLSFHAIYKYGKLVAGCNAVWHKPQIVEHLQIPIAQRVEILDFLQKETIERPFWLTIAGISLGYLMMIWAMLPEHGGWNVVIVSGSLAVSATIVRAYTLDFIHLHYITTQLALAQLTVVQETLTNLEPELEKLAKEHNVPIEHLREHNNQLQKTLADWADKIRRE